MNLLEDRKGFIFQSSRFLNSCRCFQIREDNLETLEQRCVESGLKPSDIWWYADLRRYGTVPHAGFGLGFERLIMFVTGLENIRDVIPFPRVPGHAEF